MNYLARLKQLEDENISRHAPDIDLPKPPKAPFVSFGGTGTGHIEKKIIDSETPKPETLQDRQREARRQKVIAMLEAAPGTQRAIYTDTDSDPQNVILAIAVCHIATCEMLIQKGKYDAFRLLELIERMGVQNVH